MAVLQVMENPLPERDQLPLKVLLISLLPREARVTVRSGEPASRSCWSGRRGAAPRFFSRRKLSARQCVRRVWSCGLWGWPLWLLRLGLLRWGAVECLLFRLLFDGLFALPGLGLGGRRVGRHAGRSALGSPRGCGACLLGLGLDRRGLHRGGSVVEPSWAPGAAPDPASAEPGAPMAVSLYPLTSPQGLVDERPQCPRRPQPYEPSGPRGMTLWPRKERRCWSSLVGVRSGP